MLQKITIPIPPYFTGRDSSFLSISLQKWQSVRVGKFRIFSLIQLLKMFADIRSGPDCVYDLMLKTTNKSTIRCLWFYCSHFTQNFKLVNPFHNFFFHIGTFKFLCTKCLSKVPVPFIGDLNFGSRKHLFVCCDASCLTTSHAFIGSG